MKKYFVVATATLGLFLTLGIVNVNAQTGSDKPKTEKPQRDPLDKIDWEKPDHGRNAKDFAKDAANDFGRGRLGDAAEKAGYAAGAAWEKAKEVFRDKNYDRH